MKVKLNYKDDFEYVATNETDNKITIDMLPPDKKNHQSPVQLLLSALGACASVEIVSMIKKRRKTFINLEVEVEGTRREEFPKGLTSIHIKFIITSPDLTHEDAERIIELSTTKYCSVAYSLSAKQTHTFEIKR